MNIPLWIAQGLLAAVFLATGGMKLVHRAADLKEKLPALRPFSPATLKVIGTLEVLGAVGVVLPLLLGVLPGLTAWAAVGLALTMLGAAAAHIRIGEVPQVGMTLAFLALAAFVAWGRWGAGAA